MRQGQQNRRGRGRNNNRKSQNPLTRSFESAGPDVKIRGTPSHIAEKYMTLARDALSSGDPVLAENYMQHAEHYNRIIMSFREQQISQGGDPYAGGQIARGPGMPGDPLDGDEFGDEDGDEFGEGRAQGQPDLGAMPQPPGMSGQGQGQGHNPGPRNYEGQPRYDNRQHNNQHRRDNHRQHNNQRHDRSDNRFDRHDRGDRHMGNDNRGNDNRPERHDRGDRPDFRGDRPERQFDRQPNGNGEHRGPREDRGPRDDRGPREDRVMRDDRPPREERIVREDRAVQPTVPDLTVNAPEQPPVVAAPAAAPMPRRRERFQPAAEPGAAAATPVHQQPEFLRRPVRRPRPEPAAEDAAPAPAPRSAEETE